MKCENGPVLPPAQVFYFNGQALIDTLIHESYLTNLFYSAPSPTNRALLSAICIIQDIIQIALKRLCMFIYTYKRQDVHM
jgi:hypothetical protein